MTRTAKATTQNNVTVTMKLEKETTGAARFHEVDGKGKFIEDYRDCQVGSLYLRKTVMPETLPKSITVNVTF